MSLADDLKEEVRAIVRGAWTNRDGQVVPEPEDLKLGNDGVKLDATVLYADLDGSTDLVDRFSATFAAEVYKSYLVCAARIVKTEGGVITAYDGDRIMAVFIEGAKNTAAVRAALKINWAVGNIVNPEIKALYTGFEYIVRHHVGVDTSSILAARIGVRNGRAANYAAKLSSINDSAPLFITGEVYDAMLQPAKFGTSGANMWTERKWTDKGGMRVFSSTWQWSL